MDVRSWRCGGGGRGGGAAGGARAGAIAAGLACVLALPSAASGQELEPAPAVAGAAPGVLAQPEPSAAQRETARTWVLEGRRLFGAGEHAAALERYAAAYRLVHVPTVGIEVARAQEILGKWVEANATAVEVINLPRGSGEPAVFERAREASLELMRGLTPRIPALQLQIAPAAAQARVAIDGEEMHFVRDGMPFKLNPGAHELRVHAPGYRSEQRTVTLLEREVRVLSISLVQEPPPAPGVQGAGALVPLAPAASGGAGTAARTRGHVALGLAGLAGLLGSVTGVLAFTSKPACPGDICPAERRAQAERSRGFGTVANVSFGAAFLAAAYGGWELLFNASTASGARATTSALRAGLVARERGAALQVEGTF